MNHFCPRGGSCSWKAGKDHKVVHTPEKGLDEDKLATRLYRGYGLHVRPSSLTEVAGKPQAGVLGFGSLPSRSSGACGPRSR